VREEMVMSTIENRYQQYLRDHKFKSSKRRDIIFQQVMKSADHFTIDDLYQELLKNEPDIGIATIYRNIRLFVEIGIIIEHSFGEKKGFYELIKSQLPDHGHLICQNCGKIIEFEYKSLDQYKQLLFKKYKFKITSHKLEIFGFCPKCQE